MGSESSDEEKADQYLRFNAHDNDGKTGEGEVADVFGDESGHQV